MGPVHKQYQQENGSDIRTVRRSITPGKAEHGIVTSAPSRHLSMVPELKTFDVHLSGLLPANELRGKTQSMALTKHDNGTPPMEQQQTANSAKVLSEVGITLELCHLDGSM